MAVPAPKPTSVSKQRWRIPHENGGIRGIHTNDCFLHDGLERICSGIISTETHLQSTPLQYKFISTNRFAERFPKNTPLGSGRSRPPKMESPWATTDFLKKLFELLLYVFMRCTTALLSRIIMMSRMSTPKTRQGAWNKYNQDGTESGDSSGLYRALFSPDATRIAVGLYNTYGASQIEKT